MVLAVGPDLQLDRAARDALAELVAGGYRLALMDYEHGGPLEPLLPLAHVVGLNVAGLDRGVLRGAVAHLRESGVRTLARGVEQHDELEVCIGLGFDLLQGYFICRPRVVSETGLKVIAVNRVRLLARLHDHDIDFDELQEIIGRDIALSYNLLRFINSAFFALPRRVESIRDALVLLGAINVRKWATLMALADSQDKPRELVVTGLVRARMCELLAAGVRAPRRRGRLHHRPLLGGRRPHRPLDGRAAPDAAAVARDHPGAAQLRGPRPRSILGATTWSSARRSSARPSSPPPSRTLGTPRWRSGR